MKKLMSVLVCVLMIATAASAATTSISETRNDYSGWFNQAPYFVPSGENPGDSPWDRNSDWSYSHDLATQYNDMVAGLESALAPNEYIANLTLVEASLVINAYDVESGLVDIYGDSSLSGALNGVDDHGTTTFTSTAGQIDLADLADWMLDVDVQYTNQSDRASLLSSILTLTFTYDVEVEEQPATIPAPGAVLLGSLGAGLVGWLRRKKSL